MDIEKLLREIRIVACTVLVGVLCARVATLPDITVTTDKLNSVADKVGVVVDKAGEIEDKASKFGHQVSIDYYDPNDPQGGFYRHIMDDLANSTQASKHLDNMLVQTNTNLNGKDGVFSNVNILLAQVTTSVKGLSNDLDKLTTSTSETLTPLKASLSNVDVLTKELAEEIKKGGNVDNTVVKLNKNLDDVDKLLSDPNIALTIKNGQEATASFASSAKTLDIVTMPYRKKISQVRLVLGKLLDAFKITWKIF